MPNNRTNGLSQEQFSELVESIQARLTDGLSEKLVESILPVLVARIAPMLKDIAAQSEVTGKP